MSKKDLQNAAKAGSLENITKGTEGMDYKSMRKAAFGDSKTDLMSNAQNNASKSISAKQTSIASAKINTSNSRIKGAKTNTKSTIEKYENTLNTFQKLGQGFQATSAIVGKLEQLEQLTKLQNAQQTQGGSYQLSDKELEHIENLIARARRH